MPSPANGSSYLGSSLGFRPAAQSVPGTLGGPSGAGVKINGIPADGIQYEELENLLQSLLTPGGDGQGGMGAGGMAGMNASASSQALDIIKRLALVEATQLCGNESAGNLAGLARANSIGNFSNFAQLQQAQQVQQEGELQEVGLRRMNTLQALAALGAAPPLAGPSAAPAGPGGVLPPVAAVGSSGLIAPQTDRPSVLLAYSSRGHRRLRNYRSTLGNSSLLQMNALLSPLGVVQRIPEPAQVAQASVHPNPAPSLLHVPSVGGGAMGGGAMPRVKSVQRFGSMPKVNPRTHAHLPFPLTSLSHTLSIIVLIIQRLILQMKY
ncbi:hypothetical protein T492DRAFT_1147563 [Pavlovales sp. CCMP2436]|nr:hypothetical protein T492DRAFT_1147563 [Pavlovales sp. CCMP2436]